VIKPTAKVALRGPFRLNWKTRPALALANRAERVTGRRGRAAGFQIHIPTAQ
jgi:hypothetical protein